MRRGAVSCERRSVECKVARHANPARAIYICILCIRFLKRQSRGYTNGKSIAIYQAMVSSWGGCIAVWGFTPVYSRNKARRSLPGIASKRSSRSATSHHKACDVRSRGKSMSPTTICSLRSRTRDPDIVPRIRQHLRQLQNPSLHASISRVLSPPTQRRTPTHRDNQRPSTGR